MDSKKRSQSKAQHQQQQRERGKILQKKIKKISTDVDSKESSNPRLQKLREKWREMGVKELELDLKNIKLMQQETQMRLLALDEESNKINKAEFEKENEQATIANLELTLEKSKLAQQCITYMLDSINASTHPSSSS